MDAYVWLKLVHVLSAIAAVGSNLTYFWWLRRAKEEAAHGPFILEGIRGLDARIANPAYIILPLTGIAMVLVGDLGFSTFWIAVSIGLYVALGAFAGIFFAPSLRRQLELAVEGDAGGPGYAAAARRTTTTGSVTMLLILTIVVLMVVKPT